MTRSRGTENLTRERQPMPDFVREAIEARGVVDRYESRPAYQRNDYLLWINGAKREETKRRRLERMLDELERGGSYMRMRWTD